MNNIYTTPPRNNRVLTPETPVFNRNNNINFPSFQNSDEDINNVYITPPIRNGVLIPETPDFNMNNNIHFPSFQNSYENSDEDSVIIIDSRYQNESVLRPRSFNTLNQETSYEDLYFPDISSLDCITPRKRKKLEIEFTPSTKHTDNSDVCVICQETKDIKNCVSCYTCDNNKPCHSYCKECYINYQDYEYKKNNNDNILCPLCKGEIIKLTMNKKSTEN